VLLAVLVDELLGDLRRHLLEVRELHGVAAPSLGDGAQVDVTVVSHEEDDGERSQGMEDRSWDALTRLLAECAIDTGVPDLASQHDHYLYGTPKK